jgi:hypothetical protein
MALNHSSAVSLRRQLGPSVDLCQLLDLTQLERGLHLGEIDIVIVDPEEVSVEFFAALVIVSRKLLPFSSFGHVSPPASPSCWFT